MAEIRRRPPPYYGKSVPELKFNVSNASFVQPPSLNNLSKNLGAPKCAGPPAAAGIAGGSYATALGVEQ